MMMTNYVSDYINLLVRIAHIICNHALYETIRNLLVVQTCPLLYFLSILLRQSSE